MKELSLKDKILDSQDNIEIDLKRFKEMEKAFRIVGNSHVADIIRDIVTDIEKETKKAKFLADQIGVE